MKRLAAMSSCLIVFLALAGCGGGGGGGGDGGGTTQTASISGALNVPLSHAVEAEPNNIIDGAQEVTKLTQISGDAAAGDAGFEPSGLPGTTLQDLFLLDADEAVRIVLTLATDDLENNNLDLVLMTEAGEVLDTSKGLVATETLETPGAGSFLVGVWAAQGGSAYLLSFEPLGTLAALREEVPPGADFVPGEILVKLKQSPEAEGDGAALASRFAVNRQQRLPGGIALMRIDPGTVGAQRGALQNEQPPPSLREATLERVRQLRRDPAVAFAEPNYILQPQLIPNDQHYDLQWHYRLINLPEAWDVSVGGSDVSVAVLDTGILPDHPDFAGRIIPGFDFISDPERANDGGPIDDDPTDAGDDPAKESSSFHGTHVAGVVGAATDNVEGVAGTTWSGGLMPLRVLGVGGGTVSDIAQAVRFAARLENVSGTLPDQPAEVINMSFGSPAFSDTLNDAVQAARGAGVTIVAAAGNDNISDPFYPASYSGVLSVSAVDLNAQKAPYSNFGPQIDLAAPGGDYSSDLNDDGHPDGVLSTLGNDAGEYFYAFLAGTSMAAPHVSGTIALMESIYPELTPAEVALLIAGDHPNTSIQIVRNLGPEGRDDFFGHGLIDASLAAQAAQSLQSGGDVTLGSILNLSTTVLNFQDFFTTITFEITNGGGGTLNILDISENAEWLSVEPTEGGAPLPVTATVDRSSLDPGTYRTPVTVLSDAEEGAASATVEIVATVGDVPFGNIGSALVLIIDHATFETVAKTQIDFDQEYLFDISGLDAGTYQITAGTDRDGDGIICETADACGTFPDLLTLGAGEEVVGIEFPVRGSVAPQSASSAASP